MTATTAGVERGSEPPPEQPGHPPLLSLTAAARTAGVSRSTLRRRVAEGAFPGAQRDAQGAWQVPVTDLIQAGLSPAVTPPTSTPMSMPVNGVVSSPESRVAQLETELAVERARRELAERLATERLDRVEDLRLALRALGPAPTEVTRVTSPARRRWWRPG